MQRKVDFDIQLKDKLPAASVKVGLAVQIGQDQDSGTWSCTAADNVLGELPANVIASLRPQTPFTAVVRSVKRAADDPEAVSSVQIRLSYQTAGEASSTPQAFCNPASCALQLLQIVCFLAKIMVADVVLCRAAAAAGAG